MGARWEVFGKRLVLVLADYPSLRVGGLVDTGCVLQLEGEQGPLRTLVDVRQYYTAIGDKQELPA